MHKDDLTILECIKLLKKFNASRECKIHTNIFKQGQLSTGFCSLQRKYKKTKKERLKFYTPEHSLNNEMKGEKG